MLLLSAKYALQNKAPSGKTEQAIPSTGLGRERQVPPLCCWLHDQNFPCQKVAKLASWPFSLHHVSKTPNPGQKFATVLSMYAPTLQAKPGVKEAFYRDLHNLLQQVDSKDKLLILGDFNTRVRRDFELWKGVQGRRRIINCNDNRCLLLEFCSEHQLIITNSLFE